MMLERIVRLGIGVAVTGIVARYLGPEKFGTLNFAVGFTGMLVFLNQLGLEHVLVRNLRQRPQDTYSYLGSALLVRFVGSCVLVAVSLVGISLLRPSADGIRLIVFFLALAHTFKSLEVVDLWFRSQLRSKRTAIARSAAFALAAALNIVLVLTRASLPAFAAVYAVDAALAGLFLLASYLRSHSARLSQWRATAAHVGGLLRDSWPLMITGAAIALHLHIDKVMLGLYLSDADVGVYSAASRIRTALGFVPQAIAASALPLLSDESVGSHAYYRKFQRLFDAMTWTGLVIAASVALLSGPIVSLVFGSEYARSVAILAMLMLPVPMTFWGTAGQKLVVVENVTTISLVRSSLGALINIALNAFLIPRFGVLGAAIATAVSFFVQDVLAFAFFAPTRPTFVFILRALNPFAAYTRLRPLFFAP
jgi:PST family polysaccharide transporter